MKDFWYDVGTTEAYERLDARHFEELSKLPDWWLLPLLLRAHFPD